MTEGEGAAMEEGKLAFRRLQPICRRLLPLLSGDGGTDILVSELRELSSTMTQLPPAGLALCWDYVLFPLACLLSSATESTKKEAALISKNSRANTKLHSKNSKRDASLHLCEGRVVEEEPEEEEEDKGRREREVIGLITANESEEGEEEEEEGGRGLTQQAFSSSLSSLSSPSLSSVSPSPDSRKLAFRHGWRVGEAVLRCMEVLLGKCPCDSANKLVFLLPSLMKAAALAREEASEEFRHSAVRCLKELLRGLHPPRVSGHMEGQEAREGVCTSDDSDDDGDGDRHMVGSGMGRIDRSDCPVAALCSEVMGITVGSLVDLLLKIDEAEVAAGSAGSKSLRTDALGTLRCLVLKLDDGDALAYFLPAMSVRLARASLSHIQGKDGRLVAVASAQTKKVGAAWSSAAVREAVSLLGDLLVLILGDTRNTGALMPAKSVRTASGSQQADKTAEEGTVDTVDSALQALRELKMQFGSKEAAADGERDGGGGKESSSSSEVKRKGEEVAKEMPVFDGNFRKLVLRVDRNEQWLSETASKLHVLISRCFPLVSLHPSPKVRLALGDTSCRLLTECRLTLKDTVPILLDCLLGLVYDDFPQVSSPMIKVISSVRVVAGGIAEGTNAKGNQDRIPKASTAANRSKQLSIDQEIIESTLQRLVAGTEVALRSKDEIFTILHLKKLASAMMVAGHRLTAASLFGSQPAAERLALALIESFSFLRGSADLISRSIHPSPSPMITSAATHMPSLQRPQADESLANARRNSQREDDKSCHIQEAKGPPKDDSLQHTSADGALIQEIVETQRDSGAVQHGSEHQDVLLVRDQEQGAADNSAAVRDLPRMPPGLMYVSSQRVYKALARVCRLVGKLSIKEGALATAIEPFAAPLRKVIDNSSQKKIEQIRLTGSNAKSRMDVHGGGTGDAGKLQRTAASAAVVLNEIVYGASGVWVDDPAEAGIELGARGSSTEHSADLLPFVMTIVREYTSPEIWELPTDMHSSRLLAAVEKGLEISGSRPREHLKMDEELKLPTREMGLVEPTPYSQLHDNAILQTVLLEGLAVFARALGRRFVSEGGLLACTLQQVLDKLGDPHPSVSEAAKLTLDSICVFCGYPSPRKLIAANADYVVDALCRNLHHLELHPRTPDLFVAVLRQTGAAPDLLPLLREPMAAILRSLEVNGRRRQPQHTVSFLLALRELTGAAEKDLMVVAGKSNFAAKEAERQAARKIEMRSQGRKRAAMEKWRKLAEGREKAGEYRPTKEDPDKDYWEFAASVEEDSEGDDEAQSVTKFGEPAAHSNGLSQVGGEDLSVQQQQQFDVEIACMTREERIRQLSASAEIAAMSVEASEPLLGSRVIRARLVAMDVVANCMRALDHAEKASTSEKKCVQAMRTILRGKPGNGEWSRGLAELSQDAELPPALPEACRLLPLVHAVWPETVLCLRHSHHAVVMRALGLISTMLDAAGGDFMVTRIREDAWPVMEGFLQLSSSSGDRRKRLMSRDDLLVLPLAPVSGTPVISSRGVWSRGPTGQHEAESMSPDALEKVRRAVLKWIIDAATDTRSAGALRLVVSSMVNTVKLFLSAKGHAKPLQAAATSALDALTKLSF